MKKIVMIISFSLGILLTSCGTYTIEKKSFISQLEDNQDVEEILHWTPIGYTKYPSNKMSEVICKNSKGELVYLYPDQNTTIKITSRSSKREFKAYFDTVIYKDDKLYGLRSRILGGLQEIDVNDIDKIEFHAEIPKTKKIDNKELELKEQ